MLWNLAVRDPFSSPLGTPFAVNNGKLCYRSIMSTSIVPVVDGVKGAAPDNTIFNERSS